MHIGQKLHVQIDKIVSGGDGLARVAGRAVFVPYACPGDQAEIEIDTLRQDYARGRLIHLQRASENRSEPPCPYFFRPRQKTLHCGGCTWQHFIYQAQLRLKKELIEEAFERVAKLRVPVSDVLGMRDPWRYRNKVQVPFRLMSRTVMAGFFSPGTHDPVDFQDCLIQSGISNAIILWLKKSLSTYGLVPYQEHGHSGWLRHVLIRTNQKEEAMVVLVTATPGFSNRRLFIRDFSCAFPRVLAIYQNFNPRKTNVILGEKQRKIFERKAFRERFTFGEIEVPPDAFLQVNHAQTEVLSQVLRVWVRESNIRGLLDLYSGLGTLVFAVAKEISDAIAVEESAVSVHQARINARRLRFGHCRFVEARSEDYLRDLAGPPFEGAWGVILDPPRSGCERSVLENLLRLKPSVLFYVSCDPATLARDAKILCAKEYRVRRIQPIDMFPQTSHVESVTLFERGIHP